ncbi:MAG: XrtA system polysaccharide deacetylase [Candidatus Methylomirabilia bacterium]
MSATTAGESGEAINFTVDVEDWYQVESLRRRIPRESWPDRESRVEENTGRILDLLEEHHGTGTFFVLGSVARRSPDLVRRIAARGHEIGSHGFGHRLVHHLTPAEFKEDCRQSKRLLEDLTGREVAGYRAPNFSITDWAVDLLLESGYRYSSSLCALGRHDRFGSLTRHPLPVAGNIRSYDNGLVEVTLSLLKLGPWYVSWSGGGFFRLLPYRIFRRGVRRIMRGRGPFTFYIHPWEFDCRQPGISGLSLKSRVKHYGFRSRTASKVAALLKEFQARSIGESLADYRREGQEPPPRRAP